MTHDTAVNKLPHSCPRPSGSILFFRENTATRVVDWATYYAARTRN